MLQENMIYIQACYVYQICKDSMPLEIKLMVKDNGFMIKLKVLSKILE